MTNRELDTFIIGFAIGSIACLWLGYRLRLRVEQWQARREARASAVMRRNSYAQDIRVVLKKPKSVREPRVIPLKSKHQTPSVIDPDKVSVAPIPIAPGGYAIASGWTDDDGHEVRETAKMIREDALAALTGAGYKRRDAEAALDACTMVERAGGLESWVAAAFRRAASKS